MAVTERLNRDGSTELYNGNRAVSTKEEVVQNLQRMLEQGFQKQGKAVKIDFDLGKEGYESAETEGCAVM